MKIRITLVRSPIGRKPEQKKTVKALGLRKINQSVVKDANPAMVGMAKSIAHLVKVEEIK